MSGNVGLWKFMRTKNKNKKSCVSNGSSCVPCVWLILFKFIAILISLFVIWFGLFCVFFTGGWNRCICPAGMVFDQFNIIFTAIWWCQKWLLHRSAGFGWCSNTCHYYCILGMLRFTKGITMHVGLGELCFYYTFCMDFPPAQSLKLPFSVVLLFLADCARGWSCDRSLCIPQSRPTHENYRIECKEFDSKRIRQHRITNHCFWYIPKAGKK